LPATFSPLWVFQGGPDDGQRSRLIDGHRGDAPATGMSAMGIDDAVHRWA
jgi:hypothetical protein